MSPPFMRGKMIPPLIFGPIPPFNNPPIEPQYFKPRLFFISNVTLGQNTTVTTSLPHDYVINQLCRLLIPNGYGCRELNEQLGYVVSIPNPNEVILNLFSANASAFINASLQNKPQIVAVGDISNGDINAFGPHHYKTFIPGSFRNISPY